jgi:hypothetical protein
MTTGINAGLIPTILPGAGKFRASPADGSREEAPKHMIITLQIRRNRAFL